MAILDYSFWVSNGQYEYLGGLLDSRHQEEKVTIWEWTGRCKEMQDMKRKGNAVDIAITHYTRYVDDQKSYNYKDDAHGIWERNTMAT